VGKGTYAGRLAPKFGIPTISTGDLIRAEIKTASSLGKEFASYAHKGQLVPHELVMKLVQQRLQKDDCKPGYLLDGFPRTIRQAEDLEKFSPLRLVINIELKEAYLMEKIMGRRVCPCCNKNFNVAHIRNEKVSIRSV
jgi:adenylate kinase